MATMRLHILLGFLSFTVLILQGRVFTASDESVPNKISIEAADREPSAPESVEKQSEESAESEDPEESEEEISRYSLEEYSDETQKIEEILDNPVINLLEKLKVMTMNLTNYFDETMEKVTYVVAPSLYKVWLSWGGWQKLSASSTSEILTYVGQLLLTTARKLEDCSVVVQRCPLNVTLAAVNTCLANPLHKLSTAVMEIIVDLQIIIGVVLDGYDEMKENPDVPCNLEIKLEQLGKVGHNFGEMATTLIEDLKSLSRIVYNSLSRVASCFAEEVSYKIAIEVYVLAKYHLECVFQQ